LHRLNCKSTKKILFKSYLTECIDLVFIPRMIITIIPLIIPSGIVEMSKMFQTAWIGRLISPPIKIGCHFVTRFPHPGSFLEQISHSNSEESLSSWISCFQKQLDWPLIVFAFDLRQNSALVLTELVIIKSLVHAAKRETIIICQWWMIKINSRVCHRFRVRN